MRPHTTPLHTKTSTVSLHYPWGDQRPATGQRMTLLPGLHWVRMPLPFALNHINLWVLDDELAGCSGHAVVDSGVATEQIREAWQALWMGDMASGPLLRMLVTHMHPDHVGNAQWLINRFSGQNPAQFWMSATDHLAAILASKETSGYGGQRASAHFAAHGLVNRDDLAQIEERGNYYATMVPEVPRHHHRLMDGQRVRFGHRDWRCLSGYGHSPEHIALYNDSDGVLIAGDMLLPTISTNVSVIDTEPEADPLGLFLDSLERMRVLPPDTLVLPSHGLPFRGMHARIDALQAHHAERLDDVMACARQQAVCAADLLPVLFKRKLDLHQTTFAMGEAVAHLNHLWIQEQLVRERDPAGVWRFSAAH